MKRGGVEPPPDAQRRFQAILAALGREPDPHTTVPPDAWMDVHVADSLEGLGVEELGLARSIADVGSGVGFPGLPLAIALPDARVDLIESAARRIAVIERLVAAGEVGNVRALGARAEEWAAGEGREAYDAVIARAVAPLAVLVEYASPLLREGGVLVAWKGRRDRAEEDAGRVAAERAAMTASRVLPVEPYPGSTDRHLHVYVKTGPTPEGLPRRPGIATKRPLA